jgi:uncharacterized protein (TIGR02246 family)
MSQTNSSPNPIEDEAAIRQLVEAYTVAWNNHDAQAMGTIFADNADFIGGSGGRMAKNKFQAVMAQEHASIFKNFQLGVVEQIRFLNPDIGIVDGSYKAMETESDAAKSFTGLFTLVMRKAGGQWLCVAMRSISQ